MSFVRLFSQIWIKFAPYLDGDLANCTFILTLHMTDCDVLLHVFCSVDPIEEGQAKL